MPVVPRYGGPRVSASPTPDVRVSPAAPRGAFGSQEPFDAAQDVAQAAGRIAEEERQKANDVITQKAYTQLVQRRNALVYGQNGVASRTGERAFGVRQEFGPQFDTAADEIEKNLADEDQRVVFRRMREQERREFSGMLDRHEANERTKVEDQTFGALVDTAMDDAVKNYDLPGKVERSLAVVKGSILSHAHRRGLSPEQTRALYEGAVSKTHSNVIARMLALEQDKTALDYYAKHKDEVRGEDAMRIEGALQEGSVRGDSARKADMIYSAADTLKDALGMADNIEDVKTRDLTKQRLRERFRDDEIADEQEQGALFDKALKTLQQYEGINPRLVLPPEEWNRLDAKYQDALMKRHEAPAASDPEVWLDFVEQLKEDPGAVARMTRAQFEAIYWSKFDRQDRARAEAIWVERGNAKKQEEFKSLYSEEEMVFKAFQSSGVAGVTREDDARSVGKDATKNEARARFKAEADAAFKGFFSATGKNPTDDEKQQILDRLSITWAKKSVTFKRYDMGIDWLDSDEQKKVGDITEADIESEEFDIPPERKQAYYLLARSVGRAAQTENIETFTKNNQRLLNMAYLAEQKGVSPAGLRSIIENWGK